MMDDLSFIVDVSQEEQKTKYLTLQYILTIQYIYLIYIIKNKQTNKKTIRFHMPENNSTSKRVTLYNLIILTV